MSEILIPHEGWRAHSAVEWVNKRDANDGIEILTERDAFKLEAAERLRWSFRSLI